MRVLFITSGKGSGHVIKAASVFNALTRANLKFDFFMLGEVEFSQLTNHLFQTIEIKMEPGLTITSPRETALYLYIKELAPDLLISDGLWFPLHFMLEDFHCRKIIFFRQTEDWWFKVDSKKWGSFTFDPRLYDHAFSIEPGFSLPGLKPLHPFVILNHNEIMSREESLEALGVNGNRPLCLVAHNGFDGEFEKIKQKITRFEEYDIQYTTNRHKTGLFPLARYMNGVDLLIGGGGYNLFYESRYFKVKSCFFPMSRKGEDQAWRLENNRDYTFSENGADELIDYI